MRVAPYKAQNMSNNSMVVDGPDGLGAEIGRAQWVQAMAAHPEFLILEFGWGEADWRSELVLPSERLEKGRIRLPQGPGLGVELNPEILAAHRVELE